MKKKRRIQIRLVFKSHCRLHYKELAAISLTAVTSAFQITTTTANQFTYLIQNDAKIGDITIAFVVDAHVDRNDLAGSVARRWNRRRDRYVIQFH